MRFLINFLVSFRRAAGTCVGFPRASSLCDRGGVGLVTTVDVAEIRSNVLTLADSDIRFQPSDVSGLAGDSKPSACNDYTEFLS